MALYRSGRYEEALTEFKKVLILDPNDEAARKYTSLIFQQELSAQANIEPIVRSARKPTREEIIDRALSEFEGRKSAMVAAAGTAGEGGKIKAGPLEVSGEINLRAGFTSQDAYWKRANYDLNERNWRMLSFNALNNGFNSYDPAIYQGLDINLDTTNKEGFNFHSGITFDPWSYTGKGGNATLTSSSGDSVDIQLKYWSNTGYTVNQVLYSKIYGSSYAIPEIKVVDGKTYAVTAAGAFGDTLVIPATEIDMQLQPVRELWVDYTNGSAAKFRLFPMAYQDQALTSNDPLSITNHHKWWEDSLWLRRYQAGNVNSGATPVDFTKGYWDNSLAFLSKDSTGTYLGALRGMSLSLQPLDGTSFSASVASPKDLWQDYGEADNVIAATRLTQEIGGRIVAGATFTSRHGFATDSGNKLDSENYVGGVDVGYEVIDGLKAQAEVLGSNSRYDLTNDDYKSKSRGNAYYFSIINRYPLESLKNVEYGYDGIKRGKGEDLLVKSKLYGAHFDRGFDSALSSFSNTRDDMFWSRYITFRRPYSHFGGFKGSGVNFDELWATRIGDGIDLGRNTLGLRVEAEYGGRFNNLFDLRNVHNVNGKLIENVARDELTFQLTDKLTSKLLGIYHKLPRTKGGVDPFIIDPDTGDYFLNAAVPDGEDPSLKTGAIGLEYAFFDWLSLNGVYQRTNDYYLAYGNYPNGIYNSSSFTTYSEYGKKYRENLLYLYDQGYFPQAPYPYYNIFKSGLRIIPLADKFEIYLDYTRNEFELAGQNSENMNHIGCEFIITPNNKLGLVLKYAFSRAKEVAELKNNNDKMVGHHNFFAEMYYSLSKEDDLILQYGEGYINGSSVDYSVDPFGGSLSTLDTQHIIRLYYRRKF